MAINFYQGAKKLNSGRFAQKYLEPRYRETSKAVIEPATFQMPTGNAPIPVSELQNQTRLQEATPYLSGGVQSLGTVAELLGTRSQIEANRRERNRLKKLRAQGSPEADVYRSQALPQIGKQAEFARKETALRLGPREQANIAASNAEISNRAIAAQGQIQAQAGAMDRQYGQAVEGQLAELNAHQNNLQSNVVPIILGGAAKTAGAIVGGPVGAALGVGGGGFEDIRAAGEEKELAARNRATEQATRDAELELRARGLGLEEAGLTQREKQFAQTRLDRQKDMFGEAEQKRLDRVAEASKPLRLGTGEVLIDPTTKQVIARGPERDKGPDKPITLGTGEVLIDPSTREVIARGSEKPDKEKTLKQSDDDTTRAIEKTIYDPMASVEDINQTMWELYNDPETSSGAFSQTVMRLADDPYPSKTRDVARAWAMRFGWKPTLPAGK